MSFSAIKKATASSQRVKKRRMDTKEVGDHISQCIDFLDKKIIEHQKEQDAMFELLDRVVADEEE